MHAFTDFYLFSLWNIIEIFAILQLNQKVFYSSLIKNLISTLYIFLSFALFFLLLILNNVIFTIILVYYCYLYNIMHHVTLINYIIVNTFLPVPQVRICTNGLECWCLYQGHMRVVFSISTYLSPLNIRLKGNWIM